MKALNTVYRSRSESSRSIGNNPASKNDFLYMSRFKRHYVPLLYQKHAVSGYASCVFCRHLTKSFGHPGHFHCPKGVYSKSDILLPGPPVPGEKDVAEPNSVTWLFKTTCKDFERLKSWEYARNLEYGSRRRVITNYETIEGLFFGTSNGAKPCHVCATVEPSIFTRCPEACIRNNNNDACSLIFGRIQKHTGVYFPHL